MFVGVFDRILFEIFQGSEKLSQVLQGKGIGSFSTKQEVKAALQFLPAVSSTVLDIGANKGQWTRQLLRFAGSRIGRVYVFEPSAANQEELRLLNDNRVTIVPMAVSNTIGNSVLYTHKWGSGSASLHKRRLDHFRVSMNIKEEVKTTTLDHFVEDNDIKVIDFMKCDIEGHELFAFEGARQCFEERKIRALSFEFGGCNIDTRTFFQDFWYFLKGYDFDLFLLGPWGGLVEIKTYKEIYECFTTTNYLASLRSKSE